MAAVIEVEELRKRYGGLTSVDGVSFRVAEREVFGIVGPNGAGKTTTVEIVEGLRRPDGGRVRVLGLDPGRDGPGLRQRIGAQLQKAALPDRLKVWEALDLYASFYDRPVAWPELLALVGRPEVVFLDELTTGLDPQARRDTWELVRAVRDAGATVVLVTHLMEEAERLRDRVAVIDRGRLVALDSPRALIARAGTASSTTPSCASPDGGFGGLKPNPPMDRGRRPDQTEGRCHATAVEAAVTAALERRLIRLDG
jgi:ABC-2 type transport system ATP-binding protein